MFKHSIVYIAICMFWGLNLNMAYSQESREFEKIPGKPVIDEVTAIKAILTEALHDYDSMYAMACALRNRDKAGIGMQGVYGLNAKWYKDGQIPVGLYQKASKAFHTSDGNYDVTSGATHFLSDYDLKHSKPELIAFRHKMVETAYIGQVHYYKEKK